MALPLELNLTGYHRHRQNLFSFHFRFPPSLHRRVCLPVFLGFPFTAIFYLFINFYILTILIDSRLKLRGKEIKNRLIGFSKREGKVPQVEEGENNNQ